MDRKGKSTLDCRPLIFIVRVFLIICSIFPIARIAELFVFMDYDMATCQYIYVFGIFSICLKRGIFLVEPRFFVCEENISWGYLDTRGSLALFDDWCVR